MNIFEGQGYEAAAEMAADFLPDLKEAALESRKEATGPPKAETKGHASFDLEFTEEQYKNFGWIRDNDILSAGYWRNFTENFADAVKRNYQFNKTPQDEFIIEVYDYYDPTSTADVVVFAKGTIESPDVTKIIKINSSNFDIIEDERRDIYALERQGIQCKAGPILEIYTKANILRFGIGRANGQKNARYNNGLDTKRRSSEIKANRIIEFHVDEDKGRNYDTVTFALPVTVGNTTGYMAVVIREEGKKYFKLHRVFMPDGSLFEFTETKKSNAETAGLQNANVSPTNVASNSSIPQKSDLSTLDAKKVQKVAPNNSPTPLKTRRSQAYLSTSEADRSKFGFQR